MQELNSVFFFWYTGEGHRYPRKHHTTGEKETGGMWCVCAQLGSECVSKCACLSFLKGLIYRRKCVEVIQVAFQECLHKETRHFFCSSSFTVENHHLCDQFCCFVAHKFSHSRDFVKRLSRKWRDWES